LNRAFTVFFNIYAKRYDNGYYNVIQNLDYRIKCIDDFDDMFDNKDIINTCYASEAFKAYF
jgi:hypothetical protein